VPRLGLWSVSGCVSPLDMKRARVRVCLRVCWALGTRLSRANTAEPIEMPLGGGRFVWSK